MYLRGLDLTRAAQGAEQTNGIEIPPPNSVRKRDGVTRPYLLNPFVLTGCPPKIPVILADPHENACRDPVQSLPSEKHWLLRLQFRYPTPDELTVVGFTILQLKPSGDGCANIRPEHVRHTWRMDHLEPLGRYPTRQFLFEEFPNS